MVLDNGRFHQAKSLEIPENIVFVFLPPYSPELNPIERLRQDMKLWKLCKQRSPRALETIRIPQLRNLQDPHIL